MTSDYLDPVTRRRVEKEFRQPRDEFAGTFSPETIAVHRGIHRPPVPAPASSTTWPYSSTAWPGDAGAPPVKPKES